MPVGMLNIPIISLRCRMPDAAAADPAQRKEISLVLSFGGDMVITHSLKLTWSTAALTLDPAGGNPST